MHKEVQTQHQWRFFAVPVDVNLFPNGCKTTFRAWGPDQVVEFVTKPKGQCLSKIGRYTGLEPVTVFCRWYPSSTCDPNRPGVEGFYLLTSLPCCPTGLRSVMDPCPFQEGSHKTIQHCLVAVHKQWQAFDAHADILQDWERWKLECAPQSDDAVECMTARRTRLKYKQPMKAILFDPTQFMGAEGWLRKMGAYADFDPNFKWPELIAIATNSVASRQFNPHPPAPRIYSTLDNHIIQKKIRFIDLTAIFYDVKLSQSTKKFLVEFLRRRIGYSGEDISTTGIITLSCIIVVVCSYNYNTYIFFFIIKYRK